MNDPTIEFAQSLADRIDADLGHPPRRVIQAITVIVSIDDDGDKSMEIVESAGMKTWEKRGILAEVLDDFSAQNVDHWRGFSDEDAE